MNTDLQKAKDMLVSGDYTCVLCRGQTVHTASKRGVAPLLAFLEEETIPAGFSAADRVVGKAAAHLYLLLKVKAVYAQVMSEPAKALLIANGVDASCDRLVPAIRNRTDTGFCPMETAVMVEEDPRKALPLIHTALCALHEKKGMDT